MDEAGVDPGVMRDAVERLRAGAVVAFPTETVYGLGADGLRPEAVRRIFELKGRPADRPLTLHVSDIDMARRCAASWSERADDLARRFWPGPLTLVVPKAATVPEETVAGALDVGLRCPNHPVALALIGAFGGPLAAPSANRSDRLPPTTPEHVRSEFAGADLFILDAGPCPGGVESTVLRLGAAPGEPDRILRPGPIGPVELGGEVEAAPAKQAPARAEGLFRVFDIDEWPAPIENANGPVVVIACEGTQLGTTEVSHRLIELPANAADCAARLYVALREAESTAPARIAIARPTGDGPLWDAIRARIDRIAQARSG